MKNALIVSLLAGCAGTPQDGDPGDPATVPEPPSDYIFEEGDLPEPTSSLEDIAEALQVALDLTMTVHAAPVQQAYDAAMAGSTVACPYVYATPDGSYWYDSCTASDGSEFDGYVFAYEAQGIYDVYSGLMLDYWYAFGGATVESSDGYRLELAGGAVSIKGYGSQSGTEFVVYQTDVGGTFAWEGPEADGTWLAAGVEPDLVVNITAVPLVNQSSIFLQGGFGGFNDGWAIAFDDNAIGGELLGLPCAEEVSGTLGVRATDGTWYDIQFQGSDGTDVDYDGAACDGCGDVFYQGEPMGEICIDFSTLVEMGVAPW